LIRDNNLDVSSDKAINRIAHKILSQLCKKNSQWAQIAYEELPNACKKYTSLCRHIKRKVLAKRASPPPQNEGQSSLVDCPSDESRLPSDIEDLEQEEEDVQNQHQE
jgi:hypothetical protein